MTKLDTHTTWSTAINLVGASPCRATIVFAQVRGNDCALAARSMR